MAESFAAVLLAFTLASNLGLFSVDNGIIAEATEADPPDSIVFDCGDGYSAEDPSIVCDSGDGFATLGGAGEVFCDKVNGCVRQDVVIPLATGMTGNGVVLLGGQELELGGQDLGFSDVSGMGMDIVTGEVHAALDGDGFDLFPTLSSGVVCGVADGDALEDATLRHTIRSPRDPASGQATGFRLGDRGDVGWLVELHTVGSTAGDVSADTFVLCAAWAEGELTGYSVVALRNGGSVGTHPNRVTGVAKVARAR